MLPPVGEDSDRRDNKQIEDPADGDIDAHLLETVPPLVDVQKGSQTSQAGVQEGCGDHEDIQVSQLRDGHGLPSLPDAELLPGDCTFGSHFMNAEEIVEHDDNQGRRRTPVENLDPANFPSQKGNHFVKAADYRQVEYDINDCTDPRIYCGRATAHLRRNNLQL